jgi:ABC-2 type transport system ATP-binding protein
LAKSKTQLSVVLSNLIANLIIRHSHLSTMLIINHLNFGFYQKNILNDINVSFEKGKIHGVLGLNGAGKTTFFRTLFGFYKPKNGTMTFDDKPLSRDYMSFLETENHFYPYIKGLEYVQLVTEMKVSNDKIHAWNELLELPLDDLIDTYSTGMKKKIAFLAIILQNRPILILDEPFNGIDLETSERLFLIIKKLRDNGKTIILSSHILSSLMNLCDKILHLKEGNIVQTFERPEFNQLQNSITNHIESLMENQFSQLEL